MAIPATATRAGSGPAVPWAALDAESKRRRLLDAAAAVFAREGLEAPVPAIAAEAGAGVGSVYRAFGSKDDIVAALAAERLAWFTRRAERALAEPDATAGLESLLRALVTRDVKDRVLSAAVEAALEHPDLAPIRAEAVDAFERLLARAREQGGVRPDLSGQDVRIVLVGVRAAEAAERGAGERLLELALAGLRA